MMLLHNFTIMYVEDDTDTQEYLRMMLEDDCKELYIASNGIEGVQIYQEKKPDIILTDINMPHMDGLSMIREIKKINQTQPIVVVSAYDDKENILSAINMGGNGFVPKPIDMDLLTNKLNCIAHNLQEKIDLQKLQEKKVENLYQLAHYDTLTQIPNKYLFDISLQQTMSKAKRENSTLALFFIDLDNFKRINDTYGHNAGDTVLKSISSEIQNIIRNEDILARRSGDEFLLLIEGIEAKKDIQTFAEKIIHVFEKPVQHQDLSIDIGASIGISRFPLDTDNAEELIHFADMAMYKIKKNGKSNFSFYN